MRADAARLTPEALPVRSATPRLPIGSSGRSAGRRLLRLVGGLGGLIALGLFLALAPLSVAVALVLGAIGAVSLLLWPMLGLCLLAFAVPFGSLRQISLAGVTLGASELLVAALAAVWSLRALSRQSMGRLASRSQKALAWALLATLLVQLASLSGVLSLPSALKELAKWGEALVLYLLVTTGIGGDQRRWVVSALLTAGALQGVLGIYQFLFQVGPPGFVLMGRYMRAHGTFLQPNPYAGYLGLLLPLAYATAAQGLMRRQGADSDRVWRLALAGLGAASAIIMLLALLMSWSRGALLGLVGGVALVVLAWGKRVWVAGALAALALVAVGPQIAALVPSAVVSRMLDMVEYVGQDLTLIEVNDENFSLIERAAHWQAAWRMFSIRPWLGVGVGQYAAVYPSVAVPRWQDPLGHAHNYYLHVMAETGLAGLTVHLALVATALAGAWRRARRAAGMERALALGSLGMLGHLALHNLLDNLYVHEMYLLVALILGLALARGTVLGEVSHARVATDERLQI